MEWRHVRTATANDNLSRSELGRGHHFPPFPVDLATCGLPLPRFSPLLLLFSSSLLFSSLSLVLLFSLSLSSHRRRLTLSRRLTRLSFAVVSLFSLLRFSEAVARFSSRTFAPLLCRRARSGSCVLSLAHAHSPPPPPHPDRLGWRPSGLPPARRRTTMTARSPRRWTPATRSPLSATNLKSQHSQRSTAPRRARVRPPPPAGEAARVRHAPQRGNTP